MPGSSEIERGRRESRKATRAHNQRCSRIEQCEFRLNKARWGLHLHLFLHAGPPCPESLWKQSSANIFESGFLSSLLCSSQQMRDGLCKCFSSPTFLLFRLLCPRCKFLQEYHWTHKSIIFYQHDIKTYVMMNGQNKIGILLQCINFGTFVFSFLPGCI